MKDSNRLRRRFLMAMGLLAAACEDDPAAASAADTAVDAAVEDTSAASDVAADATAVDVVGGSDATEPGTDATSSDAAAETDVAVATDAQATTDATSGSDAGVPVCEFGGTAQQQCLTASELLNLLNNPPMGGKAIPYDGPLPPTGCPAREKVLDGCCQPAVTEGVIDGDRCCYYWCPGACCGRPLLVDAEARTAPLRTSADWCGPGGAAVAELSPAVREALGAAWRADGADEHASIASFARFALDLLALGAPPELLRDTAQAMQDEVRHASQCLGIARELSGQAASPAGLPLAGLEAGRDLRTAAVDALREGCVGETLAAAVLTEAAEAAPVELVERLLLMAADETRHAELSWRFVAWALRRDAADNDAAGVRAALGAELRALRVATAAADPREALLAEVGDRERQLGGRLPAGQHQLVCQRALQDVAVPCLAALLDATRPALA